MSFTDCMNVEHLHPCLREVCMIYKFRYWIVSSGAFLSEFDAWLLLAWLRLCFRSWWPCSSCCTGTGVSKPWENDSVPDRYCHSSRRWVQLAEYNGSFHHFSSSFLNIETVSKHTLHISGSLAFFLFTMTGSIVRNSRSVQKKILTVVT